MGQSSYRVFADLAEIYGQLVTQTFSDAAAEPDVQFAHSYIQLYNEFDTDSKKPSWEEDYL